MLSTRPRCLLLKGRFSQGGVEIRLGIKSGAIIGDKDHKSWDPRAPMM